MENKNTKLLTAIYQNAKIAIQSLEDLTPIIKCVELMKEMSDEEIRYQIIVKECVLISTSENNNLKDTNWFDKAKVWTEIKFSTYNDNSTQHIAEMLIIGTMTGMIDIIKELSGNKLADNEVLDLGKKLLSDEEKNVENLKVFLKDEK